MCPSYARPANPWLAVYATLFGVIALAFIAQRVAG
jgi:hypothetical protein